MPPAHLSRWQTLHAESPDPDCRAAFGQVLDWHVLHRRAIDCTNKGTHLTDLMAQACFAEMARIEGELVKVKGCAELGLAKLQILMLNYDIGGSDYPGGLANPTLVLMLSCADDMRLAITERVAAEDDTPGQVGLAHRP